MRRLTNDIARFGIALARIARFGIARFRATGASPRTHGGSEDTGLALGAQIAPSRRSPFWLALAIVICSASLHATDLAARYPATLDWSEPAVGREWTCDSGDVWELTEFTFKLEGQLEVRMGPSLATFGHSGTNVVWAHVDAQAAGGAGTITTHLPGGGEGVASVWMRFNPALVGELFPAPTVVARDPTGKAAEAKQAAEANRAAEVNVPSEVNPPAESKRAVEESAWAKRAGQATTWAKRAAAWKMRASWHSGNLPVIPWRKSIVLDIETTSGARRFYSVDTEARTVKVEPYFESRPLPKLVPVEQADALKAFDAVWQTFDREYAMFTIRPQVDWTRLRDEYRPRAAAAKTSYEAAAAVADMLAALCDLHVWVMCGDEGVPCYRRNRPLNGDLDAVRAMLGGLTDSHKDAMWGRTDDGLAYLNITALEKPELPQVADEMLEMLGDSWGLVIDLRFNGGGGEDLGQQIAGRFLDRPALYSRHQYRSGPAHADLGAMRDRLVRPRGPWRWQAPVVVLIGQRTMSSAESFALMLAQCPGVVTMGDRTAGSSGKPRRLDAGIGITVNMPTWVDYLPDGTPLEERGITPSVAVAPGDSAARGKVDPVLEAALAHLRKQPPDARIPGRPR